MRAMSQTAGEAAISSAVTSVRQLPDICGEASVRTDSEWFAEIAEGLLGKDAGFQLHLLTDFEERTCYRYAAGDTKPPAYFLRALLRGKQGKQWYAALMDGCEEDWWIESQLEIERARQIVSRATELQALLRE